MNICDFIKKFLYKNLEHYDDRIIVEPIKEERLGDFSTNAAMILAKSFKTSPHHLAHQMIPQFLDEPWVESCDVAGPGFLNLKLKKEFWLECFLNLLTESDQNILVPMRLPSKGLSNEFNAFKSINIEFVSVNPTGPLHAGHGRVAVLGDAIARLLEKSGHKVHREFYINDAGEQINALAHSLYLRYKEALGLPLDEFTKDMYAGDYLIPLAKNLVEIYQDKWLQQDDKEFFKDYAVQVFTTNIKNDLKDLGVVMDAYISEKEILRSNRLNNAINVLNQKGLIYEGILPKPKGCETDDWEERPQTLFQSTQFGDDVDRVVKKFDGSATYFSGDIAYHFDKFYRKFDRYINVFGADHAGYVKRIQSVFKALTAQDLTVLTCQMVNFLDQGNPIRMSKRSGNFITLKDVINRVGKDIVRFMMISRHPNTPIDFDFSKVIEQTKDNPIFYIQYACARIHSIVRHAKAKYPDLSITKDSLSLIKGDDFFSMIKKLTDWPRQINLAAQSLEPHRIANFIHDIASQFHALWNLGHNQMELRFIDSKSQYQTSANLALVQCVWFILSEGLSILGITPLTEM